ncbi:MAG: ABC transporter ATP-binding protein [Eubacteriales bacterium]
MIITNLEKKIGDLQMQIPSLHIETGKIHGLLGGNGCGKSTLAKILIGAIELDRGAIDLESVDSSKITLMSQRPYLLQRSVYENLIYPLQIRKMPIDEVLIQEWLEKIDLWHRKDQYARSLSSGEQQKLSFLRALIFHPEVVIIDETLSNLDPESLQMFENWIKEWQQQEKITWIIISHQLIQINNLCDRVHFMQKGNVIESGSKDEVIFNSKNEIVKNFVECQMIRKI